MWLDHEFPYVEYCQTPNTGQTLQLILLSPGNKNNVINKNKHFNNSKKQKQRKSTREEIKPEKKI